MFVNGIPFLFSISAHIYFIAAVHLKNRLEASVGHSLKQILGINKRRGFKIELI